MGLKILFATGVLEGDFPELATRAKELFVNSDSWGVTSTGHRTTLKENISSGTALTEDAKYSEKELAVINDIKNTILTQAEAFLAESGHSYKKDSVELKVTGLWFNEMESDSWHTRHIHYGSLLSGCFYVEVPPHCAGIVFSGPLTRIDRVTCEANNFTMFNSDTWTLKPEAGNMLMWESYLQHEVPRTQFFGKRRSIAFNVSLDVKE